MANGDEPPAGSIAHAYYKEFGSSITKAKNDRIPGWALVEEQMRVRDDGLPRLLIHSTCVNLIRTLPAAPRDIKNPDDVDTHAEEHALDALRYLCYELIGKAPVAPFHAESWARNRHTSTVTGDMASVRL
jgi:hypothetical protein